MHKTGAILIFLVLPKSNDMADHNELGKKGERLAVEYLRRQGLRIRETNWRYGRNEIDIIAEDEDCLVIIEVKTRESAFYGKPESFVNKAKQQLLIRGANAYIRGHNIISETRFDIVSVILSKGKHQVNHILDAFYPVI